MYCTNCGRPLDDDCSFCIYCGAAVTSDRNDAAAEPLPRDEKSKDTGRAFKNTAGGIRDLDMKLGYAGAAVTAISVFFSFAKVSYGGFETEAYSLISKELLRLGAVFLMYGIIAAVGLWFGQRSVYIAMTVCTLVFVIFLLSIIGRIGIDFSEYIKHGAGYWLLIIGMIIMMISSVWMIVKVVGDHGRNRERR